MVLACLGLGSEHALVDVPIASLLTDFENCYEWEKRVEIINQLGKFRENTEESLWQKATMKLRGCALADPDWQVRIAAVRALRNFEGINAAASLKIILQEDLNDAVRAIAAQELGELGNEAPTATLLIALQDQYWGVRAAAVQALGNVKNRVSIDSVIVALDDVDSTVRIEALRVLSVLLGDEVKGRLSLIAWRDHDELVREEARAALKSLGANTPLERLQIALEGRSVFSADEKDREKQEANILEYDRLCEETSDLKDILNLAVCADEYRLSGEKEIRQDLDLEILIYQKEKHIFPPRKKKRERDLSLKNRVCRKMRRWRKHSMSLLFAACIVCLAIIGSTMVNNAKIALDLEKVNGSQWHGPVQQPKQVVRGQTFSVSLSFFNSGSTTWSEKDGYTLGCMACAKQNQNRDGTATQIVSMGDWSDEVVPPGQEYRFQLSLRAPQSPGIYRIRLKMKCHSLLFGEPSGVIEINVVGSLAKNINNRV